MIKKYDLNYNDFNVSIAIDHEKFTEELMHEINNFFSDAKWRLSQENGDICQTVLKMIAEKCFYIVLGKDYNAYGVMDEFNEGDITEGYPPMDGSIGIQIVSVSTFEIDACEIYVCTPEELDVMPALPKGNI
jgi:Protein of unknown function (DUF2528)